MDFASWLHRRCAPWNEDNKRATSTLGATAATVLPAARVAPDGIHSG